MSSSVVSCFFDIPFLAQCSVLFLLSNYILGCVVYMPGWYAAAGVLKIIRSRKLVWIACKKQAVTLLPRPSEFVYLISLHLGEMLLQLVFYKYEG